MNPLNVFTGPDSIKKYFDPDFLPLLPLVEVAREINPFFDDGVRIYAKMMTMHPSNNVKAIPVTNMLERTVVPGQTKTVIEYSSGSTVISMAMIAKAIYGIDDTRAFLSNKTSEAKLKLMRFFGLDITLFGGPSQPEPLDPRGGIQCAANAAASSSDSSVTNPNQYENDNNWQAHVRWTGPQILKQLPQINVICAGMGTSGTMTGLGSYFKATKPSVLRLGVCTAAGDRVPGPRSYALLSPVEFPWREAVDAIEEVGSYDSYSLSLDLCREGLLCGPSSGFNLKGLLQMLEKRKADGTLAELKGLDGRIHCVFLCCDLPYQYIDEYYQKLGAERFHPIRNERLKNVDLHRYDEAWERVTTEAISSHYDSTARSPFECEMAEATLKEGSYVIDLRQPSDFETWHLPGAINLPLKTLDSSSSSQPSPFSDAAILEAQWLELEERFRERSDVEKLEGSRVLLACYGGDTARVATSVLQAKGIRAESVKGGYRAILEQLASQGRRDSVQHEEEKNGVVAVAETAVEAVEVSA